MRKSGLVVDKIDKSLRMLDEVIDEIERDAKFFGTDIDSHFIECLGNNLQKNGVGEVLIETVKTRLLINRRTREFQ